MAQIPHGPEHLMCPFHKKTMDKVCHTCPLWTMIRGINQNTGVPVDNWNCGLGFLPILLVETAQQSRAAGAAFESMRNEAIKAQVIHNGAALLDKFNGG